MGWILMVGVFWAGATPTETIRESFDQCGGKLPAGWHVIRGDWKVEQGALVGQARGAEGLILFGDPTWQNYEMEITATFLKVQEESRWCSLVVRAAPGGAPSWCHVAFRQNSSLPNGVEFAVRVGQNWSVRGRRSAPGKMEIGKPYRVRVVVEGSEIVGYLEGRRVIQSFFCLDRTTGCVGLAVNGACVRFDDLSLRRLPDRPRVSHPATKPLQRCEVIAHRGFSVMAPENTLVAISKAIEAGADGCEFDVYRTRDGQIVLMHDATVDRTTDGQGKVTELTLAELKRLDAGRWKGQAYAGQRVPTLQEALELLKRSSCRAVIEMKMKNISRQVVETVRSSGMTDQAVIGSFDAPSVREVRQLAPEIPAAWISGKALEGTVQQQADQIASQAAACQTDLVDLVFDMLSPQLVEELHRRGLKVWVWTVNDPVVMEALRDWGVDGLTTDNPGLARTVLDQSRPSPPASKDPSDKNMRTDENKRP